MLVVWRLFHRHGVPKYLARHYWWAYLWRPGIWLFDHQLIINLILFGYYRRILTAVLRNIPGHKSSNVLQIANAYGELLPALTRRLKGGNLHLVDVATPQLDLARSKLKFEKEAVTHHFTQMNSETLGYHDASFDVVSIFLLLHELPPPAREATLHEAVRVLKPGGKLIIAEYGRNRGSHFLHRIVPLRWLLTYLEPFLATAWREDLIKTISRHSEQQSRNVITYTKKEFFGGFYQVVGCTVV